jgi:hypothetical protein
VSPPVEPNEDGLVCPARRVPAPSRDRENKDFIRNGITGGIRSVPPCCVGGLDASREAVLALPCEMRGYGHSARIPRLHPLRRGCNRMG